MNNKYFNDIVRNRLDTCKGILTKKNEEYSSDTDRLHNFKVAARTNNTTPELALWGMYTKHLVSVMDLKDSPETATKELLAEKITDSINYHLLLEALLQERITPKHVGTITAEGNYTTPKDRYDLTDQKYIDLALEEATKIATVLWGVRFKKSHPEWEPLDNLLGVLAQISSMVVDMVRVKSASVEVDKKSLLPCPFCGGKVIGPIAADSDWWIECSNCEIIMSRDSKHHLMSEWNSRP